MVVSGRNKKTTLNLRLFDREKSEVTGLADQFDVAAADLVVFALTKVSREGLDPQELADFVVQRHNPKLAGIIKSQSNPGIRISETPAGDRALPEIDDLVKKKAKVAPEESDTPRRKKA